MASVQVRSVDFELSSSKATFSLPKLAPYLLVALFSGVFLLPFLRTMTWNLDEGIYLYGAQVTALGAIPGRDFVELQGPGTFYWLALFFKVFGPNLFTARALLLLTGTLTAVLIFHLSRRLGAVGLFAAVFVTATSIPLDVMNSPHYDSNLFALLSFTVFLYAVRQLETGSAHPHLKGILLASGALAGFTTCFLQQKGVYLALAFVVTLALLHRKTWVRLAGPMAAGYACVVLTEFLLYAYAQALPSLIYANFTWPLSTYESVNRCLYGFDLRESLWRAWFSTLHIRFSAPLAFAGATLFSVPYLLILAVPLLLPAITLRRRSIAFRRDLIPYWIAGYALWASELHRVDLGHLRNGCLILVVLFFSICERQRKSILNRAALSIVACLVLSATGNVLAACGYNVPLHTRRGILFASERNTALEFLLSNTKPGEAVFVYPYAPLYYFLADVRNPTRWSNLMYGINTGEHFREAVHDLEREKVHYVLWDISFPAKAIATIFPAYHEPPPAQLIMEPYLETHYHQIAFENGFRILERNN